MLKKLVGQSVEQIADQNNLAERDLFIKYQSPPNLLLFKNDVIVSADKTAKSIITDENNQELTLIYNVDEAGINYKEVIKDGLLGSLLVIRQSSLSGSYIIEEKSGVTASDEFTVSIVDTVGYDDIASLENPGLPYTRSELPGEPLFPSLIEPVVAVGAAVVAIVLFFTVRSN